MNEQAILWILGVLVAALFALVGALYAIHNTRITKLETASAAQAERMGARIGALEATQAVIQAQNARQERDVVALQAQNTAQEATLASLTQRMIAREDAHAEHRQDVRDALANLTASIKSLGEKIDQALGRGRSQTPGPGRYDLGGQGGQGGGTGRSG